jgi:hypothetical protein
MQQGTLVLNGITDPELVKILDVKIRHENSLNFNPQQMQVAQASVGGKIISSYNNVALVWANEDGLEAVQEIVHFLLKKEGMEKAVGR